jgi:hypothetical protein
VQRHGLMVWSVCRRVLRVCPGRLPSPLVLKGRGVGGEGF